MDRPISQWRDRIAGRLAFDRSEAEAAIRRAYRASALPEPQQIVWAVGPQQAAQALAFLEAPPRRLRLSAFAYFALGAAIWVGLALMLDSAHGQPSVAVAASLSAVAAAFNLSLAGKRHLPPPPGEAGLRRDKALMFAGPATVFIALAVSAFALQMLGLPSDSDWLSRGIALALTAVIGGLPGLLLILRIRSAYRHLPDSLRDLAPQTSVARHLESSRAGAWACREAAPGPRPDRSLLEVYRNAHWNAFTQGRRGLLNAHEWTDAPRVEAPSLSAHIDLGAPPAFQDGFGDVPPHVDGLEDAARAAAVSHGRNSGAASAFADLAFHVDRVYPFATIAVAVAPPTTLALDAGGRPHAEGGPALAWADGTSLFAWQGREVPSDTVDCTQPVTLSRIRREWDPERRWVLIERYGLGDYLEKSGAIEIHHDDCGQLYRLDQPPDEPIVAVRVRNCTPEPDGTVREFWLRVPPTVATAQEAVAWTFGLSPESYQPTAQS